MKILKITPSEQSFQDLFLGHRGENLALNVVFNIAPWVELYGFGTAHLLHQRNNDDAPYPVATIQDGLEVSWAVSDADTAVEGHGKYELRYYVGEALVKSSVGETYVGKALVYGATPPDPIQGWLDHVTEKESEILEAARMASVAEAAAERSEQSSLEAKAAQEVAVKSKENASASEKNAAIYTANAAQSAAEAKEAALTAKGINVTAKPGQLIRVKSVDENGKPTAWEAVPWGYTEGGMVEILPETDAVEGTDPNYGKCWQINKAPDLTVGETYTVIYNGVQYDCVCQSGDDSGLSFAKGAFLMGNNSVIGGADTGEPFAMVIFPDAQAIISLDLTSATSVRIGIMGKTEIVHPIPGKLLPEGVPYVEQGELVEILPECKPTYVADNDIFIIAEPFELVIGEKYTVNWNGTEYASTAYDSAAVGEDMAGGVILLNDGTNLETGEGAVLLVMCFGDECFAQGSPGLTELTISIKEVAVKVHPIDPRCLPNNEFVVNLDNSNASNITADKTVAEIYNAIKNGKTVLAYFGDIISPCSNCGPNGALFMIPRGSYTNGVMDKVTGCTLFYLRDDGTVLVGTT